MADSRSSALSGGYTSLKDEVEEELLKQEERRLGVQANEDATAESVSGDGKERRPSMTFHEKLLLSPWEKWLKYQRFPWKFVLHILLIILTCGQIMVSTSLSSYLRAADRNWRSVRYLYTVNESRSAIQSLVENYYSINETAIAGYEHREDKSTKEMPMPVALTVWHSKEGSKEVVSSTYKLRQNNLGPFAFDRSPEEILKFLRPARRMTAAVALRDRRRGRKLCLDWLLTIAFDLGSKGQIGMYLESSEVSRCPGSGSVRDDLSSKLLLNLLTLAVGGIYGALVLMSLLRSFTLYVQVRTRHLEDERRGIVGEGERGVNRFRWRDLPLRVKLKFFSGWSMLSILATILLMISSVAMLHSYWVDWVIPDSHRLMVGLGCALLCVGLVGYMEHNLSFYSVVITLRLGLPRVLQFLVGVTPLFLGYSLFGVAYFGDGSERFRSVKDAMIFLFAVLNGDSIRDSFDELTPLSPVVAQIYLYSFISLFMYIVLNMFIAIMEEAFFASRAYKRTLERFGDEEKRPQTPSQSREGSSESHENNANPGDLFRQLLQKLSKPTH